MANDTERREGGAWIGQHPDENTEQVREQLPDDAERVAVTNNTSGGPARQSWPSGHREGDQTGDDDIREAGLNR